MDILHGSPTLCFVDHSRLLPLVARRFPPQAFGYGQSTATDSGKILPLIYRDRLGSTAKLQSAILY